MKLLYKTRSFIQVSLFAMTWTLGFSAFGLPAQTPLLTRGTAVAPDIVFMFDDSGSMGNAGRGDFLYQESAAAAWGNPSNFTPNSDGIGPNTQGNNAITTWARCSPEINQIYYNPKVQYLPPFNSAGVRITAATSVAWGGNVCKNNSGDPLLYRYIGSGPYWDGTNPLDRQTSYPTTKKWTITSGGTYPPSGSKDLARNDCAGATTCTGTEELQNFANWYKWYRYRIDMAKNATIEAFAGQPATFRLGWGLINTLGDSSVSSRALTSGVKTYDSAVRTNFINFLNGITVGNSPTPSRIALDSVGQYFKRTDSDGPWGTTPNAASTGITTVGSPDSTEATTAHASCRRANAMLVTDGYYNETFTPTFADVATTYWSNDLNASIPDRVKKVTGIDDATWQHLNFWAIGLGVDGTLTQDAATLASLKANPALWPTPVANTPSAIDDMWHATINGRGGILNAGNPAQLTGALTTMIGQILKSSSSQAGVAASTANLTSGALKFVPVYTTGEWTGNMIAKSLDPTTGNETGIRWKAETRDAVTDMETSNTLYPNLSVAYGSRSQANRNIVVGTSYDAAGSAVAFTFPIMTIAGIASSITPAFSGQVVDSVLIDYLRGDRSQESDTSTRKYRARAALLGDIANSTPTLVKPAIDYGYTSLPTLTSGQSTYAAFLTTKGARAEGGLFVGANDGMLHVLGENDGREMFAFVPRAVLPNIAKLADPTYQHRYYVDGPLTQGDYYNGSAWKNVVVGTTGAGAKSVFAVDATTPTSLTKANVLWEVASDLTTSPRDFSELGNVLSNVQIGLMRNGKWAAIFGNGFDSKSGKAQLFIVNLNDGTLIQKIDTLAGSNNNGLGGVRLVLNSSNQVIGAYGGDLLGNMWRFDLSDTSETNWNTGYGTTALPVPLYQAKDSSGVAQPITAAPFVMVHPSGGYLVAFGTGKFFEDSDLKSIATQSAYGIRDKLSFGDAPSPNPTVSKVSGTSTLVLQTIAAGTTRSRTTTAFDGTTSTQNVTYYSVTSNAIDWSAKDGWTFNLPNSGQRTVFPVDSLFDRIVRIDTIQPGAAVSDPCLLSNSGLGYNYIINALTGGSPQDKILDTNGDGAIDSGDGLGVSGYSTSADGRDISLIRSSSTAKLKDIAILSSNGEATSVKLNLCTLGIVNCSSVLVNRTWRQLFLR